MASVGTVALAVERPKRAPSRVPAIVPVLCSAVAMGCSVFAMGCSADDDAPDAAQRHLISEDIPSFTMAFQQGILPGSAYLGTDDATLWEGSQETNLGASVECVAAGAPTEGTSQRRCVLRWSILGIPAGSRVERASIDVHVLDGTEQEYQVREVLRGWSEREITWTHADLESVWEQPGGQPNTELGSVVATAAPADGAATIALNDEGIAMVQRWVDGGPNFGVMIIGPQNGDCLRIASSEHARGWYRPSLSLTYVPPAGGAAEVSEASDAGAQLAGDPEVTESDLGLSEGQGVGSTEPNLLVAFIGDQGIEPSSKAVLELIHEEGAAAVVHNGDFDYAREPETWNQQIDAILGEDFPYFAIIGNHDADAWSGADGYASLIAQRHARVPEMVCTGELGIKASCNFRGLFMVQSCIGSDELRPSCAAASPEHLEFIGDSLAADTSIWSICNWHKNQADMQLGSKSDGVGWEAYRLCMNAGAIIATGHEHSYSRTLTLDDLGNAENGHGAIGVPRVMDVGPGTTFVFVSGIAGQSIRDLSEEHVADTWWASYYTHDVWMMNGVVQEGTADHGALFIRFHVDGNPRKARGYFKDISGRIADEFVVYAH